MKRRTTGDHAVTPVDAAEWPNAGTERPNAGSVHRRGHHPEPVAMQFDAHALYKRIYAIRFALRCRVNRRTDTVDTLTILERAITKLRREEIELVEHLQRIDPHRLAQLDESTADWRTR